MGLEGGGSSPVSVSADAECDPEALEFSIGVGRDIWPWPSVSAGPLACPRAKGSLMLMVRRFQRTKLDRNSDYTFVGYERSSLGAWEGRGEGGRKRCARSRNTWEQEGTGKIGKTGRYRFMLNSYNNRYNRY